MLTNCTVNGNSAGRGGDGGSGYYGHGGKGGDGGDGGGISVTGALRLINCTVSGNFCGYGGDGGLGYIGWPGDDGIPAASGISGSGGGLWTESISVMVDNSVVYFNTAPYSQNCPESMSLNYCCTTPVPTNGFGNITNAPLFVDYAGANLRLQSNSPCINAGNNYYASGPTDLDGKPRISGGTVDIGAYEFQSPASQISYAWLQQYELPIDGSADLVDTDGDGHNNWQEWRCLTCPTNALSVLRLLPPSAAGTDVTLRWESVVGVIYSVERSTNTAASFSPLATNVPGQPGTTSFTDTNAGCLTTLFYRLRVH